MKSSSALRTLAQCLADAKTQLKPAICDLAATNEDYHLESTMKIYLSLAAQERKAWQLSQHLEEI